MAEVQTVDAVRSRAATLLARGQTAAAKSLYAQILQQLPYDTGARAGLRAVVQRERPGDPTMWVSRALGDLAAVPGLAHNAALGWQYTDQLEAAFIDPTLVTDPMDRSRSRLEPGREGRQALPDGPDAGDSLRRLTRVADVTERWHALRRLIGRQDRTLLADSFHGLAATTRAERVARAVAGPGLTIVILGAGCVGLALANALKCGLGRKVTVLVVETRVESVGVKRPYTRDWLTNVRTEGWETLFDPAVVRLFNGFGRDGFMGVPINAFETLLYLSCKQKGVAFLFEPELDTAVLGRSAAHLVVDATGGRLGNGAAPISTDHPPVAVSAVPGYGRGHASHGITDTADAPAKAFELGAFGSVYRPLIDGRPMAVGMIKLTGLPVRLYEALLPMVRRDNADGHIYLWPGTLRSEINQALALVCLKRPAFAALGDRIDAPMPLAEFLARGWHRLPSLDSRFVALLRAIADRASADDPIGIEPPFVFAPTYRPIGQAIGTVCDKPLLPVGDSLYTGNPKVGNGMAGHLNLVRTLHDLLLVSHEADRAVA